MVDSNSNLTAERTRAVLLAAAIASLQGFAVHQAGVGVAVGDHNGYGCPATSAISESQQSLAAPKLRVLCPMPIPTFNTSCENMIASHSSR